MKGLQPRGFQPQGQHGPTRAAGWLCGVWLYGVLLCCVLGLSGCGKFFHPASSGTGSAGGGSGGSGGAGNPGLGVNNVYLANNSGSLQGNSIAGFSLTSGKLANLPRSPYAIAITPSTVAINRTGNLLYAGSNVGQIFVYVINPDGSLSLGNSNNPVIRDVAADAMVVDPSGNWLLVLSGIPPVLNTGSAPSVLSYRIDPANGVLTLVGSAVVLDSGSAGQLVFAPNGTQLYASLGTGGVDALSFNPSTGVPTKLNVYLAPGNSNYSDQGLAIDPLGKYLFNTETGSNSVRVYAIHTDSTLSPVGLPYPTGPTANSASGPKAVLVDKTGAYVYVGNSTVGTISGYSLASTGVLTALAGSPFATGINPSALAESSTGGFIVAASQGGTPDLQVYSTTGTTPGALVPVSSTANGASPSGATAIATTP